MSTYTHLIQRYDCNSAGRDYIVGDVHGCFTKLKAALDAIGFDPERDRLFSVGDLVDRGPESTQAIDWLAQPWFHAVMGNHEQMAVMYAAGELPADHYSINGGAWFIGMTKDERFPHAAEFFALPLVIEVETAAGLVGIVHAACDFGSWDEFKVAVVGAEEGPRTNAVWGRSRANGQHFGPVGGVRAVVVGHTPMEQYLTIDNVHFIDTGAWVRNGTTAREFTILDAATLRPVKSAEHV